MDLFAIVDRVAVNYDLEELVKQAPSLGLFMEFGVCTGGTLVKIATSTRSTVYGFDWWEGIPEDLCGVDKDGNTFVHDPKGSFKGRPGPLPNNVILIEGLFADTVPLFQRTHEDTPVSFIHIDCDLYSSTKTVLDAFRYNFHDGAIIAFDEFIGYGNGVWALHEYKAFIEFLEDNPQYDIECIACSYPRVAFKLLVRRNEYVWMGRE